MVRLTLSRGRMDEIRVNEVVSTIAHFSGIPGNKIGRINIEDKHTLFDVPEEYVEQVLAESGNYRIRRMPATVEMT
jgi:ATP-dependent RNA helicase DeaD